MFLKLTKEEQFAHKKMVMELKNDANRSLMSRYEIFIRSYPKKVIKKWIESLSEEEFYAIFYDRDFIARPKQLPPNSGKYRVWIVNAGRGFGKTWVGAQELIHKIRYEGVMRTSIAGRTFVEAINVMILGESGILNLAPPDFQPTFKNKQLVWPNGAVTLVFSAEKPDSARGIQNGFVWFDEAAAYRYPDFYDQMMLGLRLRGTNYQPGAVITTTPRPVGWFKKLIKRCQDGEKGYYITNGSTFENRSNLATEFIVDILASYPKGSLLAEQELYGKVVEENADALFKMSLINKYRVYSGAYIISDQDDTPKLGFKNNINFKEIVVAIDPSVTANAKSDLAGLVVVGLGEDDHFYVIEDASGVMKTEVWSLRAVELYHKYSADVIVAEINNGGDLVENSILSVDPYVNYETVRATRGKKIRAEPVSSLYHHGRVHHIGYFDNLEAEMCGFTGAEGEKSPDRMDALVWGITKLMDKGKDGFLGFIKKKLLDEEEKVRLNKIKSGEVKENEDEVKEKVNKNKLKPESKSVWGALINNKT